MQARRISIITAETGEKFGEKLSDRPPATAADFDSRAAGAPIRWGHLRNREIHIIANAVTY
jgi:hypothetical protein